VEEISAAQKKRSLILFFPKTGSKTWHNLGADVSDVRRGEQLARGGGVRYCAVRGEYWFFKNVRREFSRDVSQRGKLVHTRNCFGAIWLEIFTI
jgi:hypothetical protein